MEKQANLIQYGIKIKASFIKEKEIRLSQLGVVFNFCSGF